MRDFKDYWTFSAIRGAMTLVAAVAILALPQAASSMLSIPVLIALAIDCFAIYTVFDGAVMILLEKLLPGRARNRRVLYVQSGMGMLTGALLFVVTFGAIPVRWAIWAAAAQAAVAAVCEWIVARDTHAQYGCLSCYNTAILLGLSALLLPLSAGLEVTGMSLALAVYVGLYGSSELLLGARMLFLEYRAGHPASVASTAWRDDMDGVNAGAAAPAQSRVWIECTARECAVCPAAITCADDTPAGQVARIMALPHPLIVRTVRAAAVLAMRTAVPGTEQLRRSA
jgi:hypothetical protein